MEENFSYREMLNAVPGLLKRVSELEAQLKQSQQQIEQRDQVIKKLESFMFGARGLDLSQDYWSMAGWWEDFPNSLWESHRKDVLKEKDWKYRDS